MNRKGRIHLEGSSSPFFMTLFEFNDIYFLICVKTLFLGGSIKPHIGAIVRSSSGKFESGEVCLDYWKYWGLQKKYYFDFFHLFFAFREQVVHFLLKLFQRKIFAPTTFVLIMKNTWIRGCKPYHVSFLEVKKCICIEFKK